MITEQASEPGVGQRITSELLLISRAQHGEEEAFAALYELNKRRVYSLCLAICGDEAAETTQRAFLCAFRRISTFKTKGEFTAVLNDLAINLAISARKQRKSR